MQRYNGPGNYSDNAAAITVDTNGNVFVTGSSYDGYTDYATIAYSNAGVPSWTNRYSGSGHFDLASAIAVNSYGNVFVTGYSETSTTYPYNYDYATLAYSSAGQLLWIHGYNGPGNGDDQATAISADGSGNIFVSGYSWNGTNNDYATIAYSNTGAALWTNRYNGTGNNNDRASAIAVDRDGNVFVTGYSVGSGSGSDYATIKYSNLGVPLWTNRYNGSGSYDDEATAIALDTNGNAYVTGFSGIGAKQDLDYATIAYSSAGFPLWTNRYTGPGSSVDTASAIAVDGSGKVFVTGGASNGTNRDYVTIAYLNSGVPLWTNRYTGPGNKDDAARAIAVDCRGNVFVTGSSSGDYATIAYSNSGVPLWTNRYNGPGNDTDSVSGMALDCRGNVFVTGASMGSIGFFDYVTIKYSTAQSISLDIQNWNNEVVLIWTNTAFGLQSAPAVTDIFTNIPGATSPFTNFLTGAQQFFRLISN